MMTTCGSPCGATGRPPTPTTLRRSTKSTELMQFSSIRNRASASEVEPTLRRRVAQPSMKRFTVRRMLGGGDLWISELVLTYDGQPFYVVSIMEFESGEVVRETQYFSEPFEPGPCRVQWVERME